MKYIIVSFRIHLMYILHSPTNKTTNLKTISRNPETNIRNPETISRNPEKISRNLETIRNN